MDKQTRKSLLSRYSPTLRFDRRELFFPTSVDGYVSGSSLYVKGEEKVEAGKVSLDSLDHKVGSSSYLQFVSDVERRDVVREEASRLARKLLAHRLGRVGIFGRILDAIFQLSIFIRHTTPRLTTPAAALKAERLELQNVPVTYGRVIDVAGWVVLHYSYFYVMNDWRSSYRGLNDHEADWEQCWIFCDPETLKPVWIAASNHDHQGANLRRHWDDPECQKVNEHPVLYVGAGSHALYFSPGDYVTRLDVTSLRWLLRLQRWARSALRIRDVSEEKGLGPALGAPFVDTATGDGDVIEDWDVRDLDDSLSYFGSYSGLWGLDTGDPTGAERGPAGPKFTRKGTVRLSWADPVGFVDLHGSVPVSQSNTSVSLERVELLIEKTSAEISEVTFSLPVTLQAEGRNELKAGSKNLSSLLRQKTQLMDLKERLMKGNLEEVAVRSHLDNPAIPIAPPQESGWILSLWAALSVPLLLVSLASLFIFSRFQVPAMLLFVVASFSVLEQLVRRHFQAVVRLVLVYIVLAGIWLLVSALFLGVISVSLKAIGSIIFGAAVLLFVANLRELTAVQKRADAVQGSDDS